MAVESKGQGKQLPRIPAFESFLQSLTLDPRPADSGWLALDIVPARREGTGSAIWERPRMQAWYRGETDLRGEAVIRRIREVLKAWGHVDSEDLAAAFLGLYCISDKEARTPIDHLNHLFGMIGAAETEEHMISTIPPYPGSRPYSIGVFETGAVNVTKLRYRCERVGCDFFERYPDKFRNKEEIRRRHAVRILDLAAIHRATGVSDSSLQTITDNYFTVTTELLRHAFRRDFREAQEVLVAEGAPYTDTSEPMIWGSSSFVTIFEYEGKRGGYFCPLVLGITVDFASADRRIPETAFRLEKTFGFTGSFFGEIGATLRSFCRFVTSAKVHGVEGNRDEAFLHYVIALEIVFGERSAVADKVTSRTAAIAATGLGLEQDRARSLVERLYDLRSRYVHEGQGIAEAELESAQAVVREVLHALLRIHDPRSGRKQATRVEWLRHVDRLVFVHKAERQPSDDELMAAGLPVA